MPHSPLTYCSTPGCGNLVKRGKCARCSSLARQKKHARYDARRPNATARGYDHKWRKIARAYLRSHPWCEWCRACGIAKLAQDVDHIVPLANGGDHSERNLRALCRRCHNKRTARDQRTRGSKGARAK